MIDTLDEAIRYFVQGKTYTARKVISGTRGPIGMIIDVQLTAPLGMQYIERHYVFYNRRLLNRLTQTCQSVPQSHGDRAQTVQLAALNEAAQAGATISIVMQDGCIYQRKAKDWLEYARAYQTIRIPRGEKLPEAHLPISRMILLNRS